MTTRTTGNDPVEGLDPGGTRSTRPGSTGQAATGGPSVAPKVSSGDRNDHTSSDVAPVTKPKPDGGSKPD